MKTAEAKDMKSGFSVKKACNLSYTKTENHQRLDRQESSRVKFTTTKNGIIYHIV